MRLRRLKEEYAERIKIDWRGFPLAPVEKQGRRPYPPAAAGWTSMAGREEGAEFTKWVLPSYPVSSLPALEAARCAQLQGEEAALRFHLATMRAFFAQSRDVSQWEELLALAREAELDIERFTADYQGHSQGEVVQADYSEARQYGITGIPAMVVNERYLVVGARQTEEYRQIFDQLLNN